MDKPRKVGNDGTVYKCPICQAMLAGVDIPSFPFCSDRCRLVDLNNWMEGKHSASRPIDPSGDDDNLPPAPPAGESLPPDRRL